MYLSAEDILGALLRGVSALAPPAVSPPRTATGGGSVTVNIGTVVHYHTPAPSDGGQPALSACSDAPKPVGGCQHRFPEPTVEISPAAGKV